MTAATELCARCGTEGIRADQTFRRGRDQKGMPIIKRGLCGKCRGDATRYRNKAAELELNKKAAELAAARRKRRELT